jgi:protoheme IX farnesyltransferase
MLPVVAGEAETKRQMLIYTVLLLPVALAPTLLGVVGWIYGGAAVLLSLVFIVCALRVLRSGDMKPARQMFGFSILYLFLLFALLLVDRVLA